MKCLHALFLPLLFLFFLTAGTVAAAIVSINVDSGNRLLKDELSASLSGGSTTVDFDGAMLQIGYFVGATTTNNFGNGTFIPLTGEDSHFNVQTTVGDSRDADTLDGQFFSNRLDIATGLNGGAFDHLLPTVGTPLSIRIFNNLTINGLTPSTRSTFFEAISDDRWLWAAPQNAPNSPTINLTFDRLVSPGVTGLVALSGANISAPGSAIITSLPVPEPASAVLMLIGLASLTLRRRVGR